MRSRLHLLLVVGVLWSKCLLSQPIDTDRPDQTETSWTVPPSTIQGECGVTISTLPADISGTASASSTHFEILLRLGLVDGLELRAGLGLLNISGRTAHDNGPGSVLSEQVTEWEVGGLSIGAKVGLRRESGLLPEAAFIGSVVVPLVVQTRFPKRVTPAFRFSMSHTPGSDVSVGYNAGFEWEEGMDDPAVIYTLSVGLDLTDDIGVFAEAFGRMPLAGGNRLSVDSGLAWRPNTDVQFDLSAGQGVGASGESPFIGLGVSARVSDS